MYTSHTELATRSYGGNLIRTQLRRRKWNKLGYTLRTKDDSIARQVLQWATLGYRGRGRPNNT